MPGSSGLKSSWHAGRAVDYFAVYERFIGKEQVSVELSIIVREFTEVLGQKILILWRKFSFERSEKNRRRNVDDGTLNCDCRAIYNHVNNYLES